MAPTNSLLKGRQNGSVEAEFTFGRFRLLTDGTLLRGDEQIHLPPKELAALQLLLSHAGLVVNRAQLKQELWGDVHVTSDSVPRCLSSLRARLEPDHCIQTVYKRGYRLVGPVVHQGGLEPLPCRLAIMPFSIGQGVDEHLGAAIAEEVTTRLTDPGQTRISVLARDSVFTLAQRGYTAAQVGETLRADLALTGSLRSTPSHYRLRAEMIRIEDGTQTWVEDMLVPRDRVASLKSELIDCLASRLGADFTELGFARHETRPDLVRQDAYETYLRGHSEWQSFERHRMVDAMQSLLLATELDPTLIYAKIDLAHVIIAQELCGYMPPRVAADRLRSVARVGRDLAEVAPALLPPLGWSAFHVDRDVATAIDMFSQSAHLPHDAWTTSLRVMFALSLHRFEEAADWLQSALLIDPYAPWLHARLAWTWHLAGDVDQSKFHLQEAFRLFPDHESTRIYGSMLLAYQGDVKRAEKLASELVRRSPNFDNALAIHAYALARDHRENESRGLLERLQWLSREHYVSSSFTPAAYVALGEMGAAINELHNADQARCPWFFQMLADPRLSDLHGHPEFETMRAALEQMDGSGNNVPELQV
jgi:DNA-binding winged helix-turn-helix (wHTH) protein/tetratricopeptide (TPR) repeat protein